MRLSIHQQIFTQHVARFIIMANSLGINLTFGEAHRTESQQLLYYFGAVVIETPTGLQLAPDKKRTKTKKGNHPRRLAVDFNYFIDGKLTYRHPKITELGAYWEGLDPLNRWGGNFTNFYDSPHLERHV
jgi:hypothetical protein